MICIVHLDNGDIKDWIIATDLHDARRKLHAAREMELAERLYRMEFEPPPTTKIELAPGMWLLSGSW